jgi:hypothetical protein
VLPLPDPEVIDGIPEYEVEQIQDSQIFRRKLQFLVAWKGYRYEEHSWVDKKDLSAPDLVTLHEVAKT